MAESPSWATGSARPQNVNTLELVQQILQGRSGPTASYQQRSMSSGRHPRLGTSTSVQGQYPTGTGVAGAGAFDLGSSARSPRQRSASVGRRHQDVQELASVVQELSTKGRVISSMSSILQELPTGSTTARGSARAGGDAEAHNIAAITARSNTANAGPSGAVDPRSYGVGGSGASVVGGVSVAGSAATGAARGRSGAGSGSVSGKGIARSILGGVESLTSKLELLGDRLTPRKGSPRADRPRDSSTGRRPPTSSGDSGGANFRDLLAAANLGLLQGHGLPDTAQGSRDQRPLSAAGQPGAGGPAGGLHAYASAGLRAGTGSSGAGGSLYGGNVSTELAASMILQNHHRRNEDMMAADLMLQNLQAEIRNASSGGASGGGAAATAAPAQPAPSSSMAAVQAASGTAGLPTSASQATSQGLRGEASGTGRPASSSRRRGGSSAAAGGGGGTLEDRGMLQSFLATLSEAVPPPQTPMVRGGPGSLSEVALASAAGPAPPQVTARGLYGGPGGDPGSGRDSEHQRHRHSHHHRPPQAQHPTAEAPDLVAGTALAGGSGNPLPAPAPQARKDRSTAGGASSASLIGPDLGLELGQRLSELQRVTQAVTRGVAGPDTEPSGSSAGVTGAGAAFGNGGAVSNVEAWLLNAARSERREREQQPAVAAPGMSSFWREGGGVGSGLGGQQSARLRTAWAEDASPSASGTASAAAGGGATGSALVAGTGLPSARSDGRSGGGTGTLRDLMPSGFQSLPLANSGQGGPHSSSAGASSAAWPESDGLHMALLMQQRKKERARRDEQEAVEAAVAAVRARQSSSDWQAEHDKLITKYLAARQRLEALEAEHERVSREGCSSCARRRDQLQQVSDAAANAAAQLREVQAQLQEARAREEAVRRQLDHTAATASDQAAAGARLRTSFELALQEFIDLVEAAAAATSLSSMAAGSNGVRGAGAGAGGGDASSSASVAGAGASGRSLGLGSGGLDMESLMETLRARLREQGELARRQRDMLEAAQERLAEERAAAAAARDSATSERAGALALATQQANFQRERAEALQEELERQREASSKLELRIRQLEDERDRMQRQRDAAELSLQAQQAQLEAAQHQQETLVGRLYDGQRAREDAEVLQGQIRNLNRLLEEARAAAARSEALERKAALEREVREERDGQLAALQSQLAERDAALESAKRRVRELEAAANSAVASRQVAMDQISSRSDEVRTLTSENARMFRHLDRLQQEKRTADAQIQELAAQVASLQQEATTLRSDLATAKEQLATSRSSSTVMDATFANHQLSAELASARSEAAALRAAHDAAGEYAQSMARTLRRHGLPVPEPPTAAEVASQIGALQAKMTAESDALAAARAEINELRQQLSDARVEVERQKREAQSVADRYAQLEAAHAASQQSWQHSANRDAAAIDDLTRDRDALRLELHTLQVAGTQDSDELRRKMARLEVQVETLSASKREVEERARLLAGDLGTLRKALADREAQMEATRLALEDAKAAAEDAAKQQRDAEAQATQAERARVAALADADKARAVAAAEAERARAAAAAEAESARAAAEEAKARAAMDSKAVAERAKQEAEKARVAAEAKAEAERLRLQAEKERAAAAAEAAECRAAMEADREKHQEELAKMQSDIQRLEKELAERNAEYAGLYDYCAGVIGERDAAVEARDSFSAAAAAAEEEVAALRREVEELREDLADKEQKLAVKPKMAELQYRINELTAQLAEVTAERDAAVTEGNQTAQKLQDETEAHFQTDGRRVRLGEEVERLRGILRMYSIPF